ncbi:glycogen synthase GlgA [Azospirillum rugosum]|uniref:Glycogen synthase n=1 Tax=Azospirillum rugosum TaxID=416170 RepID=A0ABS4SXF2_9PROT|nr:glycogen synthase GlgA [Azospirillum rugosum]MBP2296647.1 starch synthase [Azospirillum rugosum]MDQ0530294.1 starch synthase [Azospirillum rugosum]
MRVLYVTPECYPLVKTGGLADVSAALPVALNRSGADVRLLMPGYPAVLNGLADLQPVGEPVTDLPGGAPARLLIGRTADGVLAYVLDAPSLYDRPGNPYLGPDGRDWPDNAERFAALSWCAAGFAATKAYDPWWRPEVLHGHDWQTGLIPAYLELRPDRFAGPFRPGTVLTIHNIAYQGLFGAWMMSDLGLPSAAFRVDGVEYYGGVGFLKAGCYYSDRLTTVSPTYAHEIQTDEHGAGLQGLLAGRSDTLTGILNGVDYDVWDPATDPLITARYGADDLGGKDLCKADLQAAFGLDRRPDAPIAGVVSRLTGHKGLDLVLEAATQWIAWGGQIAVLGSGEPALEAGFRHLATWYPKSVGARIGYDEALSHRIQAGSDLLLVPSRSEPCGLTQLYALKYGTLPLVRRTGGLADTIVDANPAAMNDGSATGFQFVNATNQELTWALRRAMLTYRKPERWHAMQQRAMTRDFGWHGPAEEYMELYREVAPALVA